MLGWSSIQTGKTWIRWRIITSVLTNCIEMLVFGTWVEDQTFCGLSTNLQEQSQYGLRHATDDWQDRFHTFITQRNSHKTVMWATLLSIVDWVYFKTQTLLATLRTQHLPLEESCVYSEAEHLDRKFDVQEANDSVSQFHRIGRYFFGFWFANGWTACFRSLGHGDWSVYVRQRTLQDMAN